MKVGDVLVSSWGYGQTNIDFYKVVGVTAKSVKIVRVDKFITEHDSSMSEYVIPNLNEVRGIVTTRRVKTYRTSDEQYVKINSYAVASKWNGSPMFQSHWH